MSLTLLFQFLDHRISPYLHPLLQACSSNTTAIVRYVNYTIDASRIWLVIYCQHLSWVLVSLVETTKQVITDPKMKAKTKTDIDLASGTKCKTVHQPWSWERLMKSSAVLMKWKRWESTAEHLSFKWHLLHIIFILTFIFKIPYMQSVVLHLMI